MHDLIDALNNAVHAALGEVRKLGRRTLHRRTTDILAYLDRPYTSTDNRSH